MNCPWLNSCLQGKRKFLLRITCLDLTEYFLFLRCTYRYMCLHFKDKNITNGYEVNFHSFIHMYICVYVFTFIYIYTGFPDGSASKESGCNTGDRGDAGSIPGLEDPLGDSMVTHSSILAWRNDGPRSLVDYSPKGSKELGTTERLSARTHTF